MAWIVLNIIPTLVIFGWRKFVESIYEGLAGALIVEQGVFGDKEKHELHRATRNKDVYTDLLNIYFHFYTWISGFEPSLHREKTFKNLGKIRVKY